MDSKKFFKYIVIGCGGIGSGTLYWLSKRAGSDVLGIEQFNLGHHNGGSEDHSRVIRLAYPDNTYTKLTPETYKAWAVLEKESGIQLIHNTGAIQLAKIGDPDQAIDQLIQSMKDNNITVLLLLTHTCLFSYEKMTGRQLRHRCPQFEVDDSYEALYQPIAGVLDATMGNSVHIQRARANGATIIEHCSVLKVDKMFDGNIRVHTTNGEFLCGRLIITAGAWINNILDSIGIQLPITVTQEQITYLATPNIKDFTVERLPCWSCHTPIHNFYGVPIYGISGCKVGIDAGGHVVSAETRTFEPDKITEHTCIGLLNDIIPKAVGPIMNTKTCLYTMTPDRHFIVDDCSTHGWNNVIVCCGAGHAYKFASLLGKILSELAIDGKTQYDISKFNIDREALTNPNYMKTLQLFDKRPTSSLTSTKSKM